MSQSAVNDVLRGVTYACISDWVSILTLIFGGCCSNALTLEQLTSQHPHAGNLLTFCQFLVISLHGLPKFVLLRPYPHLKPRQIPISAYALQVLLFYCLSLLNNAAFAYAIPMAVHIIFRSGGLVVSMILNALLLRRRYNITQIASVVLVTLGVILTTLSASGSKPRSSSSESGTSTARDPLAYATGIAILTAALVLGGFLGIVQDRTYARYTRKSSSTPQGASAGPKDQMHPWQESMFYLHFLSMPLFFLVRGDLVSQFQALSAGPRFEVPVPLPIKQVNWTQSSLLDKMQSADAPSRRLSIPAAYIPLLLNVITQLLCVAGVNRLTARVTSLTVTLILVVRKAVSLMISVLWYNAAGRGLGAVDETKMWAGAFMVFVGTTAYSIGSGQRDTGSPTEKEKKND
ncbi:UAA transporter [Wolfiporia cocos MD-104 SS10]|uniref:UAA transporter n=1 Tax=Wolfiporia cocos (strain MD-104) TaxID=742152 RepID=A0A2H3JHA5_WOLCO|nr:UAA transporter [Wolfiporia cocos MD-104 SS10]